MDSKPVVRPPPTATGAPGTKVAAGGSGGDGGGAVAASQTVVKTERPPPDTGTSKTKVVATGGGGGETASPLEAKWTIYAVNVQQGDAILLDLQYDDTGPHKRYLIDGGTGNKKPLENLQACLTTQKCISSSMNPVTKKKELEVQAIIVTHPDKDHVGGVTQLLNAYSYHGELVITEAFKEKLQRKKDEAKKEGKRAGPKLFLPEFFDAVKKTFGDESPSTLKGECDRYGSLHCYFPMTELRGLLYSPAKREKADSTSESEGGQASATVATGDGGGGKMATTAPARPKRLTEKFANKSSILTTINEKANGFDVLLTGDSSADLIKKVISKKEKGQSSKPHIGVFQVPHHGSKNNSNYKFYASFTASIYLVSGGGHEKYDLPHTEVLSNIIKACVDNKHNSKIVVTNSLGLKLTKTGSERERLGTDSQWREFVTIYHLDDVFNPHNPSPAVTITSDPQLTLVKSDLVIWSPLGYITKIAACKEKLEAKEVQIFKKDTESRIDSCSGELEFKTRSKKFTILSVPVPEQPWITETINREKKRFLNRRYMYMLKESISGDFKSAWFLELDEKTKDSSPKVYYAYRYIDDYFQCKVYQREETSRGTSRVPQKFTLKPEPEFALSDKLY